jgi:hypothetical protein
MDDETQVLKAAIKKMSDERKVGMSCNLLDKKI